MSGERGPGGVAGAEVGAADKDDHAVVEEVERDGVGRGVGPDDGGLLVGGEGAREELLAVRAEAREEARGGGRGRGGRRRRGDAAGARTRDIEHARVLVRAERGVDGHLAVVAVAALVVVVALGWYCRRWQ